MEVLVEMPGSSVKAGQTLSPQKALNKLEKKRVYTRLEERKHDRKEESKMANETKTEGEKERDVSRSLLVRDCSISI